MLEQPPQHRQPRGRDVIDYDPDLNWREIKDGGFNSHFGPIMFARGDGCWFGAIKLEQKHMNFGGVCHGGVYMALADVSMGVGAHDAAEKAMSATIDLEGHYLAAAKLGNWLVSQTRLNRKVSGLMFMEAELWSDGRQCMRASGIWKTLSASTKKPNVL